MEIHGAQRRSNLMGIATHTGSAGPTELARELMQVSYALLISKAFSGRVVHRVRLE